MNNQPENLQGPGAGAGAKGGLAGMSLGVSSVSAKKRAEREAAGDSEAPAPAPAARAPQLDPSDPLAPLWQLDGVAHAADVASKAIQAVHRHKANLRKHNVTGSESVLRGARASAWLEGGEPALPDDGNVTDPVLAAALRVADAISPETIGETTRVWQRAPQQVLAKFALNASPAGATEDGSEARMKAGRPVGDDKLSSAMKEQRLHILGDFITGRTAVHAGVLSAVVHGELLTMRPFEHHNGIIARAASRLTTVATGLDPRGLAVPEVYWTRHRNEYFEAAEGFASGSPEGLRAWILMHLEGLKAGAVEARGIADAV
ncbi:MAG: hypothetical protein Q4E11_09570 [Corynebacterium sp.]|uniref:hypothetical protein n=1 Tax=Corynebacterium sp. TaxID=1720 RepID=UPI0026DD2D8F|nr:hypothetical protein [Corynebacterium sp.]MDO5030808.1 hypothetical protein [Corynebacterium sp.]